MDQQTILVVEDEHALVEILTYNLESEGFRVLSAVDGHQGLVQARSVLPNLIILDLMLPGMDGIQVCRQLKSDPRTEHIRILMLTAKNDEVDEIVGFNMGADDYVSKPFKLKPLIHRIKALVRRPVAVKDPSDVIVAGPIHVDRGNHVAKLDDQELSLTPTEFRLLWTLARRPGRPFSRAELLDSSRGEDANSLERTIDVHVRSLRQKLGPSEKMVETVRGVGYRFRLEDRC